MSPSSLSASAHSPFSCPQTPLLPSLYLHVGGVGSQTFTITPGSKGFAKGVQKTEGPEALLPLLGQQLDPGLFFKVSVVW